MLYKTTQAAQDRVVKAMLDAAAGRFPFELNRGEAATVKVSLEGTFLEIGEKLFKADRIRL